MIKYFFKLDISAVCSENISTLIQIKYLQNQLSKYQFALEDQEGYCCTHLAWSSDAKWKLNACHDYFFCSAAYFSGLSTFVRNLAFFNFTVICTLFT